ncbi:hypothetical protein AUR64_08020 [Haloprofundus marisrubri]|uniref:Uncharacterized protein n=1 Tax=Haloprofundus marisrubri TaxID=1514971 RepID=A0A0W1RB43_9EURY|nr:hypothetical protein [Haloprofundus marisrubri]KTG10605.1 hypothetical protein AUR64_08020 [Haloprofundus marisrubri]
MRTITAFAGLTATVFGFAVVVDRGLAGLFDLNYLIVTLVGALALVQGVRYGLSRRKTPLHATTTDDPELRYHVPVPGDEVDMEFASERSFGRAQKREKVRDRLREAALETLVGYGGLTREEAQKRLNEGTWTDDALAAAALHESPRRPSVVTRIRAMFRTESAFERSARHVVDELVAIQEGRR